MSPPNVPQPKVQKVVKMKGPKVKVKPRQPTASIAQGQPLPQVQSTTPQAMPANNGYPRAQLQPQPMVSTPTPTPAVQNSPNRVPKVSSYGIQAPIYPGKVGKAQPVPAQAHAQNAYSQTGDSVAAPTPTPVPQPQNLPPPPPPPGFTAYPQPQPKPAVAKKPLARRTKKSQKLKPIPKATPGTKPPKQNFKQYRFAVQILKGSILPILYGVISLQMLNKYTYEFPDYFKYDLRLIFIGFLLGLCSMSGITYYNLSRAKKRREKGVNLSINLGIAAFLPFVVIVIFLAFFMSLSHAWQFSTGYFLAAALPIFIVIITEFSSSKKFFVQEILDSPSGERKLVAIST